MSAEGQRRGTIRRSAVLALGIVAVVLLYSWLALGTGKPTTPPAPQPPSVTVTVAPARETAAPPPTALELPAGDPTADLSTVTFPEQLGSVFARSGTSNEAGGASASYVSRESQPRSLVASVVVRADGQSVPPGVPKARATPSGSPAPSRTAGSSFRWWETRPVSGRTTS